MPSRRVLGLLGLLVRHRAAARCRRHDRHVHLGRPLGRAAPPASPPGPAPTPLERLSYMHQPGSEPLLYLTLGQLVASAARRFGQRDAVVSLEEDVRLSFQDVLDQADRLAAGLRRLGLQRGERVAIWGPNSWRWVVAKAAVARAGLVSVDMNPLYREQEVLHCLSLARVAAVVAADGHRGLCYHSILAGVAPELARGGGGRGGRVQAAALPDLRAVVFMADSAPPGCFKFDDLLSTSSEEINAVEAQGGSVSPDAACCIQFSSGTTGKPKAIVLSHLGMVNNGYQNGKRFCLYEKHHSLCLQVPLFHVFGSIICIGSSLNHGATLVLPFKDYNTRKALAAARSEKCTVMTGSPTMYVDLVLEAERQGASLHPVELAVTGGAPITPEFVRKMKDTLGLRRVCSVYGLSETSAVVFHGTKDDTLEQVAETVGRLGEHVEAKVVDGEGKLVPFGTPGELWVRGYMNMKEYFQNDEATRETLVDGWLRTGDKFVLQEDGYGRIVGRLKDMVIRGGENIFPKEVEDAVETHPDVLEAEVVGVPDERMGEELCACLKVRAGARVSAAGLRAHLSGRVAAYKIPRYAASLDDFPKTLSGKIQKFKLREDCVRLLREGKLDDCKAPKAPTPGGAKRG